MNSIEIEGPIFYSMEDENIFFQCIYHLPDFVEVVGAGTSLTIKFSATISETAKKQLEVLCKRWKTKICI